MTSDFTSATAKSAFWNVNETEQTYLLCEWQGYNLETQFFAFLRAAMGVVITSGTIEIDTIQTGIGWKTLSALQQLLQSPIYSGEFTSQDPVLVSLAKLVIGSLPGATQEQFALITNDDRRNVTALIIWITLYAATPASLAGPLEQLFVSGQLLRRNQTYRRSQIVIPADTIPLPMPGGVPGVPASTAPTTPQCRRSSVVFGPGTTTPPPAPTPARSNTGWYIFGTLAALALGGAVGYAVHNEGKGSRRR